MKKQNIILLLQALQMALSGLIEDPTIHLVSSITPIETLL